MRAMAGGELRDNSHPFTSAAVGVSQLYIYTSSKSPSTIQTRVHTHTHTQTHTHKFIYRFVRGARAICFRAAMMANNFWTTNKTRPLPASPHVVPDFCARPVNILCRTTHASSTDVSWFSPPGRPIRFMLNSDPSETCVRALPVVVCAF
jgi:hypothetical protein